MKRSNLGKDAEFIGSGLRNFRRKLYGFFSKKRRDLPWRRTEDPYCILISEIMLQQTQVDRVKNKYEKFIAAFPDFISLHRAPLSRVYGAWQGLGYNRRALALKRIAETIVRYHGGNVPRSRHELERLPGIGKATAASILVFAFNEPEVFIETNVRSVFIHCFFPNRSSVDDTEIAALVEKTLDRKNPRKWYSAIMDWGTMLKKQYPNPSRRSAQYKTQTPFQGSKRQLRGAIVRILLKKSNLTVAAISACLESGSKPSVRGILKDMVRDGLIRNDGGVFSIP